MFYAVLNPVFPLIKALFPKYMLTNEQLGRAMLKVAKDGAPKRVLESSDIGTLVPK